MFTLRAFHIGAVMLAYGAFVFALLLGRQPGSAAASGRDGPAGRLRRLALAGAALSLLSWLLWLGLVAEEMSGLSLERALAPSVLGTVVEHTLFGHVWLLRLVLMILLLAGAAFCGKAWSRLGSSYVMPLAGILISGLLLATLAGAGHAVDSAASGRWLHPAVDVIHLLAGGAWLGALVPLIWLVGRARIAPAWRDLASLATERFSTLGVIAVGAIVASGAVNAWYLVGGWAALVTTDYGRLLCLKLLLFAVVLGLAAHNRNALRPRIAADPAGPEAAVALRRLWRNAVAELCLGVAILVVVGALGMTPPAVHAQAGMHHAMPMD